MGVQTTAYTSGSGTFTVPADLIGTTIDIELWGKGGNGGSPSNSLDQAGGAGGGAGGYCKKTVTVSPSDSIAYSIGSSTTCSTFGLTANNGTNASSYTTAGTGGTASGGTTNTTGGNGSLGAAAVGTANAGGAGGNAGGGGTGGAGGTGSNGVDGVLGGGGGGGSYSEVISGVSYPGGSGGTAKVLFTYSAPVIHDITGSGGAVCGGNAFVSIPTTITPTGEGVAIGGSGTITFTKSLIPTANQSYSSGTIAYTGGSANYTNLSDSSDSTYVQYTGSNAYASWPITDTPSNLNSVTAVTITIKGLRANKGDYGSLDYVQILKSDGSTAITSTATATLTTTSTSFNITPSSIYYTDKTSWDGAVLKIKQDVGTGTGITIYEAKVSITYTLTGGEVYNNTGSGGAVAGGSSVCAVTKSFTSTGEGIAIGSSATVGQEYTYDPTGEGIAIGGNHTLTEGFSFDSTGEGVSVDGDHILTQTYGFVGSGEGLSIGGDAILTENFVHIGSGGLRIGGGTSNDFVNIGSGGLRIGTGADITAELYINPTGEGIKIGTIGIVALNGEQFAEGGLEIGGGEPDEFPNYGFSYYETSSGEGIQIGGDSIDSIGFTPSGNGTLIGGSADIEFNFTHVGTGGIAISDGLFANNKKYRIKWIVPSDYVETDISNFLLMLAIDLPRVIDANEIRIEDTEGNLIKHETIDIEDNRVVVAVRRDLSPSADTEGFIYYGE